jgi:hypothetical protein
VGHHVDFDVEMINIAFRKIRVWLIEKWSLGYWYDASY